MLSQYLNELIVVDTETHLTYIGHLVEFKEKSLLLNDVTIFDITHSRIPLDQYLVECAAIGQSPTRKSIWINADKVVSISPIKDIIIP